MVCLCAMSFNCFWLFLAANTILLMGKWNHACSLLVYVISAIHASGVLDFLLDRTALYCIGIVGRRAQKSGINLQLRHIGLHVQEYRKYSWTEISGHHILVWSPSLLVWSCFAWFITLCIHNRIETRLTYRNSSKKAKTGKESYFCSVLFLSPN